MSGRWGDFKKRMEGGRWVGGWVGGVDEVWLGWEALVSVFVGWWVGKEAYVVEGCADREDRSRRT